MFRSYPPRFDATPPAVVSAAQSGDSASFEHPSVAGTGGTRFALSPAMTMTNRLARWGGARLSRKLRHSMPWIGGVIALATIASTMRRKGVVSGAFDTGLNAVPFVGAAKNA